MAKKSAGILMYRYVNGYVEFLLVHPGGPFWKNKDAGAWSIPKGEFEDTEDPLKAAQREFEEETGVKLQGPFVELGMLKQKGGKTVYGWATQGDFDPEKLHSNSFEMEWPPRSGKKQSFPEVDKAAWFNLATAQEKILEAQKDFLERCLEKIK